MPFHIAYPTADILLVKADTATLDRITAVLACLAELDDANDDADAAQSDAVQSADATEAPATSQRGQSLRNANRNCQMLTAKGERCRAITRGNAQICKRHQQMQDAACYALSDAIQSDTANDANEGLTASHTPHNGNATPAGAVLETSDTANPTRAATANALIQPCQSCGAAPANAYQDGDADWRCRLCNKLWASRAA